VAVQERAVVIMEPVVAALADIVPILNFYLPEFNTP
jgi:hypothetical protein